MSTTDERVEVTPELLADLSRRASEASSGAWTCEIWDSLSREGHGSIDSMHYSLGMFDRPADLRFVAAANPLVVSALVSRIRELEKAIIEAVAEHDTQARLWSDDEFHGDPDNAEYHRLHGDLLRGYLR